MIIAVPIENGYIANQFARAEIIRFYQIENHKIKSYVDIDVSLLSNIGRSKLINEKLTHTLLTYKVTSLVEFMLDRYKINLVTGASGEPDIAVDLLIKNRQLMLEEYMTSLKENQQINCDEVGICSQEQED